MPMTPNQADRLLIVAQKRLVASCEAAFPVDCMVSWKHFRGDHSVRLFGTVIGHSECYWSRAGYVVVKNTKTGKLRSFHFTKIRRVST